MATVFLRRLGFGPERSAAQPEKGKRAISEMGQNAKYSLRADVFCFASNNRHCSIGSAGPFGGHERTLAPWLSSDRKSYGNLGEYN